MTTRLADLLAALAGDGKHKHRCEHCATIWEHENICAALSSEVFEQSHSCPHCGKAKQYHKYQGEGLPDVEQHCSMAGVTFTPVGR